MSSKYLEAMELTIKTLTTALLGQLEDVIAEGANLDRILQRLLSKIGWGVLSQVYEAISSQLTQEYQAAGWKIERHPTVEFKTLFGVIEIKSPYLMHPQNAGGVRPMKEVMGVEGHRYSDAMDRALVDFGSEKSFERAARQFEEHYGWPVHRGTVLRRTEAVAEQAQQYVQERLQATSEGVPCSEETQPWVVELDGCDIRTGIFMRAHKAGLTDRPADEVVRVIQWQEVRTGLVRPLQDNDKHYICMKGSYPQVCGQLFALALSQGMSPSTLVLSPGDGGNGLQEELARQFPNCQYILDVGHLKSHFYETAEALNIDSKLRHRWVNTYLDQLWDNDVQRVIQQLNTLYEKTENDRVRRLINHLKRFEGAVDYGRFEEQGWPVGSGEVESAHRYIPQERLKIPGAIWDPQMVNPMLALRVIRANQWWDDFWLWLQAQRHPLLQVAA